MELEAAADEAQLAAFQAALLELLNQPLTALEMQSRLAADPVFKPFQSYVDQFDLRSIEVAAEITKKWGKRATPDTQPE